MNSSYYEEMTNEPWGRNKRLHWYFDMVARGPVRDYQKQIVSRLKKIDYPEVTLIKYG